MTPSLDNTCRGRTHAYESRACVVNAWTLRLKVCAVRLYRSVFRSDASPQRANLRRVKRVSPCIACVRHSSLFPFVRRPLPWYGRSTRGVFPCRFLPFIGGKGVLRSIWPLGGQIDGIVFLIRSRRENSGYIFVRCSPQVNHSSTHSQAIPSTTRGSK